MLNDVLARLEGIEGVQAVGCAPSNLPASAAEVDAMVLAGFHYTPELASALAASSNRCRWLQLLTAGYETLEEIGVPRGILVTNAGDVWSPSVAEHAMALLLALARRLRRCETRQREARWDNAIRNDMLSLHDSRLLIVGLGGIGREVARRARAFGMHLTGVSRSGRPDVAVDRVIRPEQLRPAIAVSDAIVLAVPSSPSTRHMIGAAELAACRPHALIVNVARGDVIDTGALIDALDQGRICGAGLDVTDPEPLPADSPLWRHPNVIVSPHLGGAASPRYYERLVAHIASSVSAFSRGSPLPAQLSLPSAVAD